jgi:hypothetical protein
LRGDLRGDIAIMTEGLVLLVAWGQWVLLVYLFLHYALKAR